MMTLNSLYINGRFVVPQDREIADILSPLDGMPIAKLPYANAEDTQAAIEAASNALASYSRTLVIQRKAYLQRIHDELLKKVDELIEATIVEYGAPLERAIWSNKLSAEVFSSYIKVLDEYRFEKKVNESTVVMEPVGVAALFTPWNATAGSIAVKVAAALAAGCTIILKPSEFTPWQAQLVMEAIHAAELPAGVVNMVNGRGEIIGGALMENPKVAKVSFTGSTTVGKLLAKQAVDTMKRVTLELSGKSANIILDDADLSQALPMALQAAFMNNGQACIAGSRLLVPEKRLAEIEHMLVELAPAFAVGLDEGAKLLFGGPGKPEGLHEGYYVKPTIFTGVSNRIESLARKYSDPY